jgi:hypothetical protein
MQEGVARPISQFDKAEPFVRVVPLDGGPDRRTGGAVELWTARRCISEIAGRRLIAVVVEITATGWDENLWLCCSRDVLGWIERSAI